MSKEEKVKHVINQLKKLYYYTNQQNIYVQIKQEDKGFYWTGTTIAKDSMNLKGKQKIYLYCTCCGTKKEDVQEAIDKNTSFWGCVCFCDECHRIWFDLCKYCEDNKMNIHDYYDYDKYTEFQ